MMLIFKQINVIRVSSESRLLHFFTTSRKGQASCLWQFITDAERSSCEASFIPVQGAPKRQVSKG